MSEVENIQKSFILKHRKNLYESLEKVKAGSMEVIRYMEGKSTWI